MGRRDFATEPKAVDPSVAHRDVPCDSAQGHSPAVGEQSLWAMCTAREGNQPVVAPAVLVFTGTRAPQSSHLCVLHGKACVKIASAARGHPGKSSAG